jgi:3-dehydroquinate synthase
VDPLRTRINLGERSYDLAFVSDDLAGVGQFARQRTKGSTALVVADNNTAAHAKRVTAALEAVALKVKGVQLPPGEDQKVLSVAGRLYDRLVEMDADRQTLVVAVGGGVIGDLAGFVAATYARGLPWLVVPTTLLAMVDSSIGGKVAVNHPKAKNLIGAFHQPVGVWIDTSTLATLPDREFRSGMAEVVKYGVILDPKLFAYVDAHTTELLAREPTVLRNVLTRCCRLKANVVEKDERETTGLRAILNYGHTFAHAFETVTGYGAWLHGEAVSAGMICASRLAERRGMADKELRVRQESILTRCSLPTRPPRVPIVNMLAAMRSDKKTVAGKLRFVLPRQLGDVEVVEGIDEQEVQRVLQEA